MAADAAETDREAAVEGRDRPDLQSLTVAAAVASRDLPDPFFREIQAVAVETE